MGKKTAERIVLELKDKIKKLTPGPLPSLVRKSEEESPWEDALSALVNLGYPKAVAEKVLGQIKNQTEESISLEDLLRMALKSLSR